MTNNNKRKKRKRGSRGRHHQHASSVETSTSIKTASNVALKNNSRIRNRRRNDKVVHHDDDKSSSISDNVEAQLQLQRQKQTALQQRDKEVISTASTSIFNFFNFPQDTSHSYHRSRIVDCLRFAGLRVQQQQREYANIPTGLLQPSIEISGNGYPPCHNGNSFRLEWTGRLLAERMQLVPSTKCILTDQFQYQYDSRQQRKRLGNDSSSTWISLLPQIPKSTVKKEPTTAGLPWDLECKTHLQPSSRTFDILPHENDSENRLPHIATMANGGGIFVRYSPTQKAIWTRERYRGSSWQNTTWHHIPSTLTGNYNIHKNNKENHHYTCVRFASSGDGHYDGFMSTSLAAIHATQPKSVELFVSLGQDQRQRQHVRNVLSGHEGAQTVLNDVAVGRGGRIALAPQINGWTRFVSLTALDGHEQAYHLRANQFSKSDALCVEFFSPHNHGHDDNVVIYGHRNGSISMVDFRCRPDSSGAITRLREARPQDGSIDSLAMLGGGNSLKNFPQQKQECHQFLAHCSFGSCLLFDVRKHGSTNKSASLVHHLEIGNKKLNPTLSTRCVGVATDPSLTIALSPYVETDNNKDNTIKFAMWSLLSGQWIGSKPMKKSSPCIASGTNASRQHSMLPHCELRSTITSAWALQTDRDGMTTLERRKDAWSVWFKCLTLEHEAPNCMGSIHQLTMQRSNSD